MMGRLHIRLFVSVVLLCVVLLHLLFNMLFVQFFVVLCYKYWWHHLGGCLVAPSCWVFCWHHLGGCFGGTILVAAPSVGSGREERLFPMTHLPSLCVQYTSVNDNTGMLKMVQVSSVTHVPSLALVEK